jgi:iron(III) transport system substrate-binding protein
VLAAGAAALALPATGVHAATPLATYEGPDRTERLLQEARRERGLTIYGSMAEKDLQLLVAAFKRRYPELEVTVWRSGKHKVLQRAIEEGRAGRKDIDLVHNPAPEMEALRREGLLQPVASPLQRELMPLALPSHREWAALRVYVFAMAYNTQKVRADELPRKWEDLLDPRWKGRLGIEAKEQEWFYTLVHSMGEDKGVALLREIARLSSLSVRNGHALLNNLVVSGEVPLALTLYSYLPEQSKRKGAPIDWFVLPPAVAYTDGIGLSSKSPRPHAALLFYDFAIGEGQRVLAELGHVTALRSSLPYLQRLDPLYVDPRAVLADYSRWTALYEATISGRTVS